MEGNNEIIVAFASKNEAAQAVRVMSAMIIFAAFCLPEKNKRPITKARSKITAAIDTTNTSLSAKPKARIANSLTAAGTLSMIRFPIETIGSFTPRKTNPTSCVDARPAPTASTPSNPDVRGLIEGFISQG
jgi:hypothetical protein